MNVFLLKAFDEFVAGTTNVYTPNSLAKRLGNVESLSCSGIVYSANGTNPTLTIQFEHSPDGTRWSSQQVTPELNALALTSGAADNPFACQNVQHSVLAFVRLRIALGGTSPSGVVQLWINGRTPAG